MVSESVAVHPSPSITVTETISIPGAVVEKVVEVPVGEPKVPDPGVDQIQVKGPVPVGEILKFGPVQFETAT